MTTEPISELLDTRHSHYDLDHIFFSVHKSDISHISFSNASVKYGRFGDLLVCGRTDVQLVDKIVIVLVHVRKIDGISQFKPCQVLTAHGW
jgi:hypothetical protein